MICIQACSHIDIFDIPTLPIILLDSCIGDGACARAAYGSDSSIGTITNSCLENSSCQDIARYGYTNYVGGSIGSITNSCHGVSSCQSAAKDGYVYHFDASC